MPFQRFASIAVSQSRVAIFVCLITLPITLPINLFALDSVATPFPSVRSLANQDEPTIEKQDDDKNPRNPFDELQDPDLDNPLPDSPLTPEEEAAAQGAVGCMICSVCGVYGVFFFVTIGFAIAGVVIQIWLTVYVYNDATKLGIENAGLWAVLTFFLGVIGFLIYFLAARNNRPTQPPLYPPQEPKG